MSRQRIRIARCPVDRRRRDKKMLIKILGAALLAVGAWFAFKMLLGVIWAILSVAIVGGLIWGGLRLLKA